MKFLIFGKAKSKPIAKATQTATCTHPVAYQVTLREDPVAPTKVTGIKCTQCGAVLPPPERTAA